MTVFGGVGQNPQVQGLRRGTDIVLACPGRLEDLIGQGHCDLGQVEITVLDEADHMADLGFLPGVRRILDQTPRNGQRLLFSATLDKAIDTLVKQFLRNPVTHQADSAQSPVATHGPPRPARRPRAPRQRPRRPDQRAGPHRGLHPHQARRQGAHPPAQQERRARPSSCTAT